MWRVLSCVCHLIVIQLFMLCHSLNEGCHVGDVHYHLIHNFIKVTAVAEVQRGFKCHCISTENQLDLKQRCDALGRICVVQEVLQGAAHCTIEACQDQVVHIVCVGLPRTAVQGCDTKQILILLEHRESAQLEGLKKGI